MCVSELKIGLIIHKVSPPQMPVPLKHMGMVMVTRQILGYAP